MRHRDREGRAKLVRRCALPLTGVAVVQRVYAELVVFVPGGNRFRLRAQAHGLDLSQMTAAGDNVVWEPRNGGP
jgi:acyl CoA:acetate/3-ketoacid CoA transferase beta subunit